MRYLPGSPTTVLVLIATLTLPVAALSADKPPGPCEQITQACKSAGFVEGEYKEGYGLHVDCIDPIMQGVQQPHKADKPLPAISPGVVAACKQRRPGFGEPKKSAPPAPPPPPPSKS
jgi:hypothetical protein